MKVKKSGKWKHFKRNLIYALKNPITYLWILVAAIIAFTTYAVYITETLTESGIETPFDSIWFTLVTVFAGYYDYCVQSFGGRAAALVQLLIGMAILSMITGKVASVFMNMQMKKDKGLKRLKNMKGHFLLCGYRAGFDKILDSVLNSNPDITPDMIVLVNEAADQIEQIRSESRFRELNYVAGDFSDEAVLKRAHIQDAVRALVISDHSKEYSDLEIDSRTVLSVLTMEGLNPGLYIAAELLDSKFQKHLEMAHCDEIILTQDYEHSLLATASSGMGYSNVIRALIGDDAETGILVQNISSSMLGKTLAEYKASLTKADGILIGLLLNTGNFHERRKDALREAQKNPDVRKVVDNLKKVKELKSNEVLLTPADDFVIQPNTKAIFVKG